MTSLLNFLNTAKDLLTIIAGFSIIILLHELGHFLAARWAGIRVLGFALGFGPALVSFRKGMGVRRGSTEAEYAKLLKSDPAMAARLSPTEYRWNLLPLGGYVKMLGQDDSDPTAQSSEPDSYNMCKPWKRMIVISAGVIMNVILAAVLFVVVFRTGLPTDDAVVGFVREGSPAAVARLTNAAEVKITEPGIKPGDRIVSIDGTETPAFIHIATATAMSSSGGTIDVVVQRPGIDRPLRFAVQPKPDPETRLLAMGIAPSPSLDIADAGSDPADARTALDAVGLKNIEPGSTLVSMGPAAGAQTPATFFAQTEQLARASDGKPLRFAFKAPGGKAAEVELTPRAQLQTATFEVETAGSTTRAIDIDHVLGLAPVLMVKKVQKAGESSGLLAGDIFQMIGDVQWPSFAEGIAQIRAHAGRKIKVVVWRADKADAANPEHRSLVTLDSVSVTGSGVIGFDAATTERQIALVANWPLLTQRASVDPKSEVVTTKPSSTESGIPAGAVITAINDVPVKTLADIREALRAALRESPRAIAGGSSGSSDPAAAKSKPEATTSVRVSFVRTLASGPSRVEVADWQIPASERDQLMALAWLNPLPREMFKVQQTSLYADTIGGAISMGLRETHRTMLQTYLTFARLFQGSVQIEHLKGPVGIAHIGTILADRGIIWVMFFMAMISINLAVINFLPLPIVDGGHFVFLLYEQFTGKPVSPTFQNVVTLAGLVLIGAVFLFVTFNDIKRLF